VSKLIKKILLAEKILKKAYNDSNGKLFISFSGGKDSTVLRHITLRLYPNLKCVFSNTTNEIKEVVDYVKTFPNIITVKPKLSFSQVVKKYGFPLVSKEVSQKVNDLKHTNGKQTRITRYSGNPTTGNGKLSIKWRYLAEQEFDVTHICCKKLKKDPLNKWAKENDLKPIIALMKDESRLRSQLALYGKDDGKKIYPFLKSDWTEQDIWNYAVKYNIRFAECYYDSYKDNQLIKARTRTGCEFCGFGITLEKEDRFKRSKLLVPKKYKAMMKLKNNGITFKEAIKIAKQENKEPKLDLYGTEIKKEFIFNNYHTIDLKATTITKKCICGSKNIDKKYSYLMNFFDTPDKNGNIRTEWIENYEYVCNDCGNYSFNDLHLFNRKHRITNRLYDYIKKNINNKSMNDIIQETNLSYEKLIDILKDILKKKEIL